MKNLYNEITQRIIAQLKKGVIPWHKPWTIRGGESLIVSHSTGKGYSLPEPKKAKKAVDMIWNIKHEPAKAA